MEEETLAFYFVDGFTKDESMLKIMDSILSITEEDMPKECSGVRKKPAYPICGGGRDSGGF